MPRQVGLDRTRIERSTDKTGAAIFQPLLTISRLKLSRQDGIARFALHISYRAAAKAFLLAQVYILPQDSIRARRVNCHARRCPTYASSAWGFLAAVLSISGVRKC